MVVLHQFEASPFCDKVRRMLHYKGIAFDVREVSISALPKVSPSTRKVPVLEIGDERLVDSSDIALELERRYPDPPLFPADAHARAWCHVLEDWADESLYFCDIALHFNLPENVSRRLGQLLKHEPARTRWWALPLMRRVMPLMGSLQGLGRRGADRLEHDLELHFASLEALLRDRQWLVADHLCVADIAVMVELDAICITERGQAARDRHLPVAAWMERVRDATGGWRARDIEAPTGA